MNSDDKQTTLTREGKARLAIEYEWIDEQFKKRHGVSMAEVAKAVDWVHKHQNWVEAMKKAAGVSLIGFLASALLLALWEGLKNSIRRP